MNNIESPFTCVISMSSYYYLYSGIAVWTVYVYVRELRVFIYLSYNAVIAFIFGSSAGSSSTSDSVSSVLSSLESSIFSLIYLHTDYPKFITWITIGLDPFNINLSYGYYKFKDSSFVNYFNYSAFLSNAGTMMFVWVFAVCFKN